MEVNKESLERDVYWDSLKFLLIGFVVFGHFLQINNPIESIERVIFNFIYLFHMPLFVFVSGRFSHISNREKYRKRIITLLETLIVFQIVAYVLFNEFSILGFLTPWFHLWYLLSLVFWRLFVYFIPPHLLNHKTLILLIAIAVGILGGFVPYGRLFSIQRTLSFFPFFVIGYYSGGYNIKKIVGKLPVKVAIIVVIMILAGLSFFVKVDITRQLIGADPYYADTINDTLMNCIYRTCYLLAATLVSCLILRLTIENKRIAKLGRATMFVYVLHIFVFYIIRYSIAIFNLPQDGISLFIYSFITLTFLSLLSQLGQSKYILNPISCLCDKLRVSKE